MMFFVIVCNRVIITGVTIGVTSLVTVAVTVTETVLGESFATAARVTGTFLVIVAVTGRGLFGTARGWKIILLVIFSACSEVMRRVGHRRRCT